MLRSPRYSNFIAASLSGKCPRFLVILRSWKLIDSIVIWSLRAGSRGDLRVCVVESVFDVVVCAA